MKQVLLLCIFILAGLMSTAFGIIGQQLNPSNNDGGFTSESGPWAFDQVPTSDNDGGFTQETVYQQQFTPSQPTSGNSNSWATPGSFLTQKPEDFGQLTETGTSPGFNAQTGGNSQGGPNGLWIVDSTGLNRYPEMSIPLNGYAREEITPSVEGQISIEEMYPSGEVRTFGMGYVKPYHVYKMWFHADVPGTHMVRYNVNGYYSNIVRFYVQGNGNQGAPSQGVSTGTQVMRSGNSITRSGTGYSSTHISGGSMSISTSFG
jgi:hypothetical protein